MWPYCEPPKIDAMKISVVCLRRFSQLITAVLVMLFFYTAAAKLLDMDEFHSQLVNQALPGWSIAALLWLIPISELVVSLLLLAGPTLRIGLYASALLMLLFTGYVGLVLLNIFDRVPCSCSNLIRNMGFKAHFIFNLFFLSLTAVGIYMSEIQRKGGAVAQSE